MICISSLLSSTAANSNKGRPEFLSNLNPAMKMLFDKCDTTNRQDALKNLAFPNWENNGISPIRDNVPKWFRSEFKNWHSARSAFMSLQLPAEKLGWVSFDFSSVHYEMSGALFSQNLFGILDLLKYGDGKYRDISWVGEKEDFGLILEKICGPEDKFEIYHWGI